MSFLMVVAVVILVAAAFYFMSTQANSALASSLTGTLNAMQLTALAQNAGFSGDDLATAVAVAFAESGGNVQAYNPEKAAGAAQGKGSYGLWQIYLTAHPEYTAADLLDPQTNANAAFKIYSAAGGAFTPWSTYKSGAFLAFAQEANDATGFQAG